MEITLEKNKEVGSIQRLKQDGWTWYAHSRIDFYYHYYHYHHYYYYYYFYYNEYIQTIGGY